MLEMKDNKVLLLYLIPLPRISFTEIVCLLFLPEMSGIINSVHKLNH